MLSDVQAEPAGARPAPPWLDRALRIAGFVVALLLAFGSALVEAFLSPLHWGTYRVPASLLLAVAGNLGLVAFTVLATGRRIAVLGPAVVWTAVMITAASRTTEGDLVLTSNNWVGISAMIVGTLTFAVAGYRLILTGVRPPKPGPTPPA